MRTVTGYSYKGGTGRTLLVANLAVFAAQMGLRVVALDFDLEAPGLPYKFDGLAEVPPGPGLVDWLRRTLDDGEPPDELDPYLTPIPVPDPITEGGELLLMRAGWAPSRNYFQDLRRLQLGRRLEEGTAVDALVELQRQLADDLGADLLLIDARTGITSSNTVTTHVLADAVVALTLATPEQLGGTRSVLRSLQPLRSLRTDEPIDVHLVVSRVPPRREVGDRFSTDPTDAARIDEARRFLEEPATPARDTLTFPAIHLLHTDHGVASDEHLPLGGMGEGPRCDLYLDYWRVATAVLGDQLAEAAEHAVRTARMAHDADRLDALGWRFARPALIEEAREVASTASHPVPAAPTDLDDRITNLRDHPHPSRDDERELADLLLQRSITYLDRGEPTPALADAMEAARHATEVDPDGTLLVPVLTHLSRAYQSVGRDHEAGDAATAAVYRARSLAADGATNLHLLGIGLARRAVAHTDVGRGADALQNAAEAVDILEPLAATNPAHLPDLANALQTLAVAHDSLGHYQDALLLGQRAVDILEPLAATNPAHLPDLVKALRTLTVAHDSLGHYEDALLLDQRAVDILEPLAATNPAHLPDLANSLRNLAVAHDSLGHYEDALLLDQRAVDILEPLAATNPAHLPDLANSLRNLANSHDRFGDYHDAFPIDQRAVDILEPLAATNPAHLPDLAQALRSLSASHDRAGNLQESLSLDERAVDILESLAANNPAHLPDLANALRNLAIGHDRFGHYDASLSLDQRAVDILEPLAATNPAHLPDLANSLRSLSAAHDRLGHYHDALPIDQRAVDILEPLAATNPAHLPDLANALRNLAIGHDRIGNHAETLVAAQRAVDILEPLAANNPAHLHDLARTLRTLANAMERADRTEEASRLDAQARRIEQEIRTRSDDRKRTGTRNSRRTDHSD